MFFVHKQFSHASCYIKSVFLLTLNLGHREAGPQALDEFTEWKAVSVDFSGKIQKAQMGE